MPEYDFVNGGITAQSSYGHLIAIKNWHSKEFKNSNVEKIIFYIGINDRKFVDIFSDNEYDYGERFTIRQSVNSFLKENSFFIEKLLLIKNRYSFYINSNNEDLDLLATHKRIKDFLTYENKYQLKEESELSKLYFYESLFNNLLNTTRKLFPKSKIIIIQQQIPGCRFENNNIVYDRHPQVGNCLNLMKVYKIQDKVLKSTSLKNIQFYPMYKYNILNLDDVYDYVHTNKSGSTRIAQYIFKILQTKK